MKINRNSILFFVGILFLSLVFFVEYLIKDDYYLIFISFYIIIYGGLLSSLLIKNYKNIINVRTIYSGIYTLMIGISPIVYYFNHLRKAYNYHFIIQSSMILAGFLFMLIGFKIYDLQKAKKKDVELSNPNKSQLEYSKQIGYILSTIATVSHFYFIYKYKGMLLSGDISSSFSTTSGNGFLLTLINLNIFGIGFLYNYFSYYNKKCNIPFYLIIIMNFVCYIIRGTRTPIVYILFIIILIRNYYKRISLKNMIKLVIILLLGVGLLGVVRSNFNNYESNISSTIMNELQVGSININYIYDTFPKKTNFQFGKTLLINIKMLLPGPDDDFTVWVKKQIGIDFFGGGVTPTLIGEGYMNFGYLGAIIFPFIVGLITAHLNNLYFTTKNNVVWISYFIMKISDVFRSGIANSEVAIIIAIMIIIIYNFGYLFYKTRNCGEYK